MDSSKEKEIIWGIVILIIIAAVAFALIYFFGWEAPTASYEEADITEEAPEENVADFPEGFPLEEEVSFDESFKYIPVGSDDEQSTLSYSSNLSLEENIEIFEKFLADSGFEIINQVNEDNMAFYYAEKEGNSFSLILEDKDGEVLVSTSYLDIQ
jgi:hypothetical protein